MTKHLIVVVPLLCAGLFSTNQASAFPAFDKTIVTKTAAPMTVQVRRHCKSKQSRCYANRHNF